MEKFYGIYYHWKLSNKKCEYDNCGASATHTIRGRLVKETFKLTTHTFCETHYEQIFINSGKDKNKIKIKK